MHASSAKEILASTLMVVSLFSFCNSPLRAESVYIINGKRVSRTAYESARLTMEASRELRRQNLDMAVSKLKRALTYDPQNSAANCNLGIILARQGKNEESLKHLKQATAAAESPPYAFLNLTAFYQTTGNIDGAISTIKKLLSLRGLESGIREQAESTLGLLEKEKRRRETEGSLQTERKDYVAEIAGQNAMHWSPLRMPIKVYVEAPTNLDGYEERYDVLLREAFLDWQRATGKKISFRFVDSEPESDIDCFWTNDPAELGNGTENGHTLMQSRAGALFHAKIAIRARELEGCFPFSDNSIATTCRHEVGHALGISGHSSNPDDLMYFSVPLSDIDKKITDRDLNTVLKIYEGNLSPLAMVLDFLTNPDCLKRYGPLFVLSFLLLFVLVLLLPRGKKNKGRRKK